jgi:hypothetical protein
MAGEGRFRPPQNQAVGLLNGARFCHRVFHLTDAPDPYTDIMNMSRVYHASFKVACLPSQLS